MSAELNRDIEMLCDRAFKGQSMVVQAILVSLKKQIKDEIRKEEMERLAETVEGK